MVFEKEGINFFENFCERERAVIGMVSENIEHLFFGAGGELANGVYGGLKVIISDQFFILSCIIEIQTGVEFAKSADQLFEEELQQEVAEIVESDDIIIVRGRVEFPLISKNLFGIFLFEQFLVEKPLVTILGNNFAKVS